MPRNPITQDDLRELSELYEAVAEKHRRLAGNGLGEGLTVSGVPHRPTYPPEFDHRARASEARRWADTYDWHIAEES